MTATLTAAQLADLVQQEQAREALALEDATAEDAEGDAGKVLAAAIAAAAAAWVTAFGTLTAAGSGVALAAYLARVRQDAEQALAGLGRRASRALERALAGAAALGARHVAFFGRRAGGGLFDVPGVTVARDAVLAARGLGDTVTAQWRLAARMLTPGQVRGGGWNAVLTGLSTARRALTLVRSAVAWAVHRAINDGAAQVIAEIGARCLWVTEPDACVRCLAYAGRLADQGGMFPGGLSMDPASRVTGAAAVEGPPLHPRCRCKVVPWRDDWARPGERSLPDMLRAQAWRSIASGRGRPTESHAARIRAARTLATQRGVPDRLRRQARTAAAAGRS